ncbi:MAG: hypothetical protein EHM49_00120 [Deltaproteobacteria bacterium]|nr:MAG: hypothetical protein EHM49_00120 [Deltaproteobacteria bacterium]
MSEYTINLCPREPKGKAIEKTHDSLPSAERGSQDTISDFCSFIQALIEMYEALGDTEKVEYLERSLELCELAAKCALEDRPSEDEILSVPVYTIPLQSTTNEPRVGDFWEVPLSPGDCDPFESAELETIRWEQEVTLEYTAFGPSTKTTEYWIFKCRVPDGWVIKRACSECFPSGALPKRAYLLGSLGFDAYVGEEVWERSEESGQLRKTGELQWKVHRKDLPLPGEALFALIVVGGSGGMEISKPTCPVKMCDVSDGDCCFFREYSYHTSGKFWTVGMTFFATPTWTGGKLLDYYTDSLGWAGLEEGDKTYPVCGVYGDLSLKYKVQAEGETIEVTATDFAGYAIGTHVFLKKLGKRYGEPFSDSCLGVGEDTPAETVALEKLGESDGTCYPNLSNLSRAPIDPNSPITIKTSYDTLLPGPVMGIFPAWLTTEMTVVVDPSGVCSGDCTSGQINLATGEWVVPLCWTIAPSGERDEVVDIVCSYTKKSEPGGDVVIMPWHVMSMGG